MMKKNGRRKYMRLTKNEINKKNLKKKKHMDRDITCDISVRSGNQ